MITEQELESALMERLKVFDLKEVTRRSMFLKYIQQEKGCTRIEAIRKGEQLIQDLGWEYIQNNFKIILD